jgi:hypothetical protein
MRIATPVYQTLHGERLTLLIGLLSIVSRYTIIFWYDNTLIFNFIFRNKPDKTYVADTLAEQYGIKY